MQTTTESINQIVHWCEGHETSPGVNGSAALDKVSRYSWRPLGPLGQFKWIDKEKLQIDRSYQREIENKNKILTIASEWKWESCGAISVMQRADDSYVVVDGQNRTLAAWRRSDIQKLPCMVFLSEGLAHEAISFIEINTNRKSVSAFAKFRAKLVAKDKIALSVEEILEENCLKLDVEAKTSGTISCIAACERMYNTFPKNFKSAIRIAAALAAQEGVSVSQILVSGLFVLDRKIYGGITEEKFLDRLVQVGARNLTDNARKMSYRVGKGGSTVWADGMLEIINNKKGRKFSFMVTQ